MTDVWTTLSYEEFNKPFEPEPLPDPGFYTFELVGKGEDKPLKDEWQNAEKSKVESWFRFNIVDHPDFEGMQVSQRYTISLNEKSSFIKVVEALIGRKLGPRERVGMESDPDTNTIGLVGRRMQAVLSITTDEQQREWGKLSGMLPIQPKGRGRKSNPVVEDQADLTPTMDGVPF